MIDYDVNTWPAASIHVSGKVIMNIRATIRAFGLLLGLVYPTATLLAAETSHCRPLADSATRLACYDQAEDAAAQSFNENTLLAAQCTPAAVEIIAQQAMTPVARRLAREEAMMNNPFVIIPHGRNYILPVTYNSKANENTWDSVFPDTEIDDIEAKFQISFKSRLFEDLLGNGDLWAAYTQQNWWQVYNTGESSPFRETNYEPEVLMVWDNNWQLAGITNSKISFGINHQSNGRGNLLSRSWNRVIAGATFEAENLVTRLRVWHRIEESEADDDNPNMEKYYGYGDLKLAYHWGQHEFSALLRNNLRFNGGNKGALQLDWSLPVNSRLNLYIQYFYGYGESLIDYDVKTSRIGVGFAMNNLF